MSELILNQIRDLDSGKIVSVLDVVNNTNMPRDYLSLLGSGLGVLGTGTPLRVAFYGDSIFYGQDADGSLPPINGATQPRSDTPIPESFVDAMGLLGFYVDVSNRTWPGDTTELGLSRWDGEQGDTDFSFIMYGHNDANNYGGTGSVLVEQYADNLRKIVYREISAGSYPILVEPPPVLRAEANNKIREYAKVAEGVASSIGIPFIKVKDYLAGEGTFTVDEVHLTASANLAIGHNLASLFVHHGSVSDVSKGFYTPSHNIGNTNGILVYDSDVDSGRVYELAPGQFLALSVKLEETLAPRVYCKATSSENELQLYYSGSVVSTFQIRNSLSSSPFLSFSGPPVSKGSWFLLIRAPSNNPGNVRIEGVSFESTGIPQISSGVVEKSQALSGVHKPRDGDLFEGWFSVVDYNNVLGKDFKAFAHISSDGSTGQGLSFWETPMEVGNEIISDNSLIILKEGRDLIIRELTVSSNTISNTEEVDAFPSVVWEGELAVYKEGSTLTVFIDGVQKSSVTISSDMQFDSHIPGLLAIRGNSKFSVNSYLFQGKEKR